MIREIDEQRAGGARRNIEEACSDWVSLIEAQQNDEPRVGKLSQVEAGAVDPQTSRIGSRDVILQAIGLYTWRRIPTDG